MPSFINETGPYDPGTLQAPSANSVVAATGASAAEGVDKLTFKVPRTGLYRVIANIVVTTAGTGASQSVAPRVTYNNGSAIAAANIIPFPGAAPTAFDLTAAVGAANSYGSREQVIYAIAGTNIVLDLNGSGTFTTAAVMTVTFTIVKI